MDPEVDVTNRKSWNFIAFIINGAIGLILPIVMFFLIAYGYAIPEYSCADSFIDINVRWGLIFSIPILMLINIQSYLLTKGKNSHGHRGMVLGLSVSIAVMFAMLYAMADDARISCL